MIHLLAETEWMKGRKKKELSCKMIDSKYKSRFCATKHKRMNSKSERNANHFFFLLFCRGRKKLREFHTRFFFFTIFDYYKKVSWFNFGTHEKGALPHSIFNFLRKGIFHYFLNGTSPTLIGKIHPAKKVFEHLR